MAQLKIQSHLLWQRSKWLTPVNKHARTWGRHDDCRLGVERSRTNTKSTPTDKYESIMYMCLCALSHSFPKLDNNGARGESRGLGQDVSSRKSVVVTPPSLLSKLLLPRFQGSWSEALVGSALLFTALMHARKDPKRIAFYVKHCRETCACNMCFLFYM